MKQQRAVAGLRRSWFGRPSTARSVFRAIETLEDRVLLSFTPTPITQYHVDLASSGVNSTESLLAPSTVNVNQFSKQFTTPVDGQVYAEPLFVPNLNITSGPQQGVHNVVFVATEHDSVYAIDASGGNVLWKTSFQSVENSAIATGSPTVVNPMGATAIAPMPSGDTSSGDLSPEIGITATPVIDLPTDAMFVVAKSKQTIGGFTDHYVQILYKLDIRSGSVLSSAVIGDTRYNGGNYQYMTNGAAANTPYVLGTGAGNITVGGQQRVYFNGMREFGRVGLALYNGVVYMGFASHGDNGPYHGWMLGYNATTLALTGALNTTPNGGLGGIWQGGGTIGIDPQGYFYFETGNGSFNTNSSNFGAGYTGLPKDANYGDSFLKVGLDPTSSQGNQNGNPNGWGLKVVDFFSPFNNADLNGRDADLGSGGQTILPDAVGSTAHPHLLIGSGKEGKLYLIDRDNMGGFDPATDHVVQEQGSALSGLLNTPAFFLNNPTPAAPAKPSGILLCVMGYGGGARAFSVSNGAFSSTPISQTTNDFGYLPGSPTISADGTTNAIMWAINRNTNKLYAYRADNLGVELWDSGQAANNRDQLGTAIKFSVATVADGQVFCGTSNALVVYGPPVAPTAPPDAPSNLAASSLSYTRADLSWNDNSSNEDEFLIERTTDPNNPALWVQIGSVSANTSTYTDTTTLAETTYTYRVRAFNSYQGGSYSAYSNTISVTTPAAPPLGTGDGAFAQYFNDSNGQHLTGTPAVTRVDPQINFDWGNGSPAAGIGTDNFSAKWTGRIQAQYSELYTFYTESDDGVRLLIKPIGTGTFTTLIDHFNDHSPTEDSATYTLSAGQYYDFEMDYYENGGGAVAQLSWSSASTDKAFIPTSQLYSGAAPAAPTNLNVVAAASVQANLTWTDNASIETGYVVERKDPGGSFTAIATLPPNSTSYIDAQLYPDTQYVYRVKATNFAADSGYSNEFVLTTPIPPAKPTNAQPTAVTTTTIAMSWTDVANNEDGYRISRSAASADNFFVIAQLPANSESYFDAGPGGNGLNPGVEYEYHIQAYNVAGYNDFSGFRTATITLQPTGLAAVRSGSQVSLTWTPPSFDGVATSMTFNVYRSTTPNDPNATMVQSGLTSPAFVDSGLSNVTYYYRVTAVDAGGESAASTEVQADVGANTAPTVATPAASSANPVTDTAATLTVLGADDAGEAALTYTWAVTNKPAGVPDPTFSDNGSNSAKLTEVGFARAGNYAFTVTIADVQGLSATSTVNVTVNQTPQSLQVVPGSISLNPGATTQFSVAGTDQFGYPLNNVATITWSTTAGSIGSSGSFTAPASGTATVTAMSGALSADATVTVVSSATRFAWAPRNLWTVLKPGNMVNLTWRDNSVNEDGFIIQVSQDGTSWANYTFLPGSAGWGRLQSFDAGPLPSGTWKFRVVAVTGAGLSGPSNTRTETL